MAFSNENYLPGDKRQLFSIFFNSQRSGLVAETISQATRYASDILESEDGTIKRHLEHGSDANLGDLAASGTIDSINVDIILEEWIVDENGAFELNDMMYSGAFH